MDENKEPRSKPRRTRSHRRVPAPATGTPAGIFPIKAIAEHVPDWPWSVWATGDLIRKGRLKCIKVGNRMYLNRELVEEFAKGIK